MTLKRLFFLLATALLSLNWLAIADVGLRICPACGKEDIEGTANCRWCGQALPLMRESETASVTEANVSKPSVSTDPVVELLPDIAEAKRVLNENPAEALSLYENALAVLSIAQTNFNKAAANTVTASIRTARQGLKEKLRNVERPEILALAHKNGESDAELYHRSRGRKQFGRVWMPMAWSDAISPAQIAAAMRTLPPKCAACSGIGYEVCGNCEGRKFLTCRAKDCKNGWIVVKPSNTLSAKTAINQRIKCPECNGTTKVKCQECRGTGVVLCRKCKGTGDASVCVSCHGTGLTACTDCERTKRKNPSYDTALCEKCKGCSEVLCRKCGGSGRISR